MHWKPIGDRMVMVPDEDTNKDVLANSGVVSERPSVRDEIARIKDRIDTRLNNYLCCMQEGYDDSIVGFNEAWDEVRKIFADELSN